MGIRLLCVLAASGTTTALGACGSADKTVGGSTESLASSGAGEFRIPRVDPDLCNTEGKEVVTFDLDDDAEPDVWKLYQTTEKDSTTVQILTCKQVDFDRDGRKDYVAVYRETGEVLAEEFDLTFDGHFDVRAHYDDKTGKVYLEERDSDFDKKPDVWEKYDDGGTLESVRRDRNADGKPDVWEQYEGGELVAILYDDDYDSRVDRKQERPGSDGGDDASSSERADTDTDTAADDGDSGDAAAGESVRDEGSGTTPAN